MKKKKLLLKNRDEKERDFYYYNLDVGPSMTCKIILVNLKHCMFFILPLLRTYLKAKNFNVMHVSVQLQ